MTRDNVDRLAVALGVVFAVVAIAGIWWLGPYAAAGFPLIVGWLVVYFLIVRQLKRWREDADGDEGG